MVSCLAKCRQYPIMTLMSEWTFRDEISRSSINVPRAAFLFARDIHYPDLDVGSYMAQLDGLVSLTRAQILWDWPVFMQAEGVARFLFQEYGLQGSTADYFDPRNSYLNEVLDRRRGVPIALSVIFVYVCQRLGLAAHGVNLPGHFIAAVQDGETTLLFDPFHGGQRLTLAECADLVHRTSGYDGPFRKIWLLPAAGRETLARMLHNLRLIYIQDERWVLATAVVEHLRLLQPGTAEHVRDLGLLHYQVRHMRLAAQYLEEYAQLAPESAELKTIRRNVWAVFDRWVRAN